MKIISSSEQETYLIGKEFAKKLTSGEILGLIGDLGAGKTIFTKGLAAGLGIRKTLTSPTFVLMKVYPVKSFRSSERNSAESGVISRGKPQIKLLAHLDAYRIKSAEDLVAIGMNEYANRPDTVTVIEWADKIKTILPKKTRFITIGYKNESRTIEY
ncbi:MAG: tRNA (adenosine(37)-N6)-threonylcarbamoyltransferase complex ATPase subunit type 1 TsaE [bacterium]|nr:tRNA (adenosine(37)-N6)-threonylcarbamoyltransferase complex ATPase subunit type 1 TsaE [bacterium]